MCFSSTYSNHAIQQLLHPKVCSCVLLTLLIHSCFRRHLVSFFCLVTEQSLSPLGSEEGLIPKMWGLQTFSWQSACLSRLHSHKTQTHIQATVVTDTADFQGPVAHKEAIKAFKRWEITIFYRQHTRLQTIFLFSTHVMLDPLKGDRSCF